MPSKPHPKPEIWLVDTSILLNVFDIPKFNQQRQAVLAEFRQAINAHHTMLLPYAAIIEVGNHIAQLPGDLRHRYAEIFVTNVQEAIAGNAPWKTLKFHNHTAVSAWLQDFAANASRGIGFGDHSIIKEWDTERQQFPQYRVRIWSLDQDLKGYYS